MPWILITVGILIFALIPVAVYAKKIRDEEFKRTGKHPKGHYTGMGVALGIPLGIPIGIAMGQIYLGIPIGMCLGIAIGVAIEKKHEKELRPLSAKEMKLQGVLMIVSSILVIAGFVAFGLTYYLGTQV